VTAVADDRPLRMSWSKIRAHGECAAIYDLRREHRSSIKDIRNFVHGNIVDTAMRRWLSMQDPAPGWMAEQVDAIFDECTKPSGEGIVRWKGVNDRNEVRDLCREGVARLEKILIRHCLPFDWDPAARFEVPVTVRYLDGSPRTVILNGELDLKIRDAARRVGIWDLKMTRDNQYYRKVLGQITFYALVERLITGEFPHATGLLQPMCDQQVLPLTVDMQAVREMAGRIERTAHDIWAGRLQPKPDGNGCFGCDVKFCCPAYAMRPGRVSLAARA
jgi:PD-(D/E)XK nuclease superfamily